MESFNVGSAAPAKDTGRVLRRSAGSVALMVAGVGLGLAGTSVLGAVPTTASVALLVVLAVLTGFGSVRTD